MYRSVVWTEACPSRKRICSSSPLQSWQSRAQVRRRSCGARFAMPACRAHRLTAYQTTLAVTPASCRFPFFETLLNTLPWLTPECTSHASRSCLDHDGTGTVRSRLPLPFKSRMTHRPSRICSWSTVSPTTSERRNPHPRNNPRIAPSRQPRKSVVEAAFTNSCDWFRVSQLPLFCPSRFTPGTRRIPIASSGVSQPLSEDSSANLRIAERCKLIVEADRRRLSRCDL